MIKKQRFFLTSALLVMGSTLGGCVTSSANKDDLTGDSGLMPKGAGAHRAVVSQIGAKDPMLAPYPRAYWLDQRQAKALMPRARGALATGEASEVVAMAKARLSRNPSDPAALTMLSAALTMSHNYELAAYYASLLEQVQPGNAFALNIKGLASMLSPQATMADYRIAQDYFQKSMDADGSQVAAGLNLGSLQLELGNAAGAAAVFKTVADRCGECSAGMIGYGRALARSGDFSKAAGVFKEILAKHPHSSPALYNLALVYKNGFQDKAKAQSYLFAVIHNSRSKDQGMKDRAQIVLRSLSSQKSTEERSRMADEMPSRAGSAGVHGAEDAEILMTGLQADSEEP